MRFRRFQSIGYIKAEGCIAILPLADFLIVYIDGSIHIYAVKDQDIAIVLSESVYGEILLVPATAGLIEVCRIAYKPVVRYLNIIPMCVSSVFPSLSGSVRVNLQLSLNKILRFSYLCFLSASKLNMNC